MRHLVLLLALCIGCDDEVVPVQQAKGKKGKGAGKKQDQTTEVVETSLDPIESIRLQALNGESAEAVEAAQTLLTNNADVAQNPILWAVLENASEDLPDQGAAILSTLSPDAPLAGQLMLNNQLREVLTERPADVDSLKSRASRATGAEQAVLQARVALQERPEEGFDRRADRSSSAVALEQLKRASQFRTEASLFADTAMAVEGADAALLRAEAWLDLEPALEDRAFAELRIVGEEGTRAQKADAKLRMAEMVLDGGSFPGTNDAGEATPAPSASDAQDWAAAVLLDALKVADRHEMIRALDIVVRAGLQGGSLDLAVAHAGQVDLALSAREGGDEAARAGAKALLAQAAFRAGYLQTSLRAGREGMVLGAEASPDAAWWGGLAAFQLQFHRTVAAMAKHAKDERAEVLVELAGVVKGRRSLGLSSFSGDRLPDPVDRAIVLPMVAILDLDVAIARHERAVAAADEAQDVALQIRTRLDMETELRAQHNLVRASRVRADLLERFDTPGMKSEMAARSMLAGQTGQGFPEAPKSDLVKLWSALSSGEDAPDVGSEPLASSVVSWSKGRAARRDGRSGYSHYAAALGTMPLHRQGVMSTGSVLDGSQGLPYLQELTAITGSTAKDQVGIGLVLHEVQHRHQLHRFDLSSGRILAYTLHRSARMDLLGASAMSRAHVDRWLAGAGPYPSVAFAAVDKAEGHIKAHVSNEEGGIVGYEQTFHKLLPEPGWDITKLMARLRDLSVAVVSYQQFGDRIHGIALSNYGAFSADLADATEARHDAAQHVGSLKALMDLDETRRSRLHKDEMSQYFLPGHRLRLKLFDPMRSAFLPDGGDEGGIKVGKYLIVAPRFLNSFNFGSLPENDEGFQVLGFKKGAFYMHPTLSTRDHNDRSMTLVTRPAFLGAALPSDADSTTRDADVELSDEDLVALSRKGLNIPPDLSKSKARFADEKVHILANEDITRDAWFEWLRGAKYIYLSEFELGPNAEFVVKDGMIALDEIRASPIRAELVVISANGPVADQVARANAFLEAGARNVLVLGWDVDDSVIESVVPEVLDGATRNVPTGDRMALVVKKVLATAGDTSGKKPQLFGPETRGAFLLFGSL